MRNLTRAFTRVLLFTILSSGVYLAIVQDLLASDSTMDAATSAVIPHRSLLVRDQIFDWFGVAPSSGRALYSALGEDGLALYVAASDGSQERMLLKTGLDWATWAPSTDQIIYWTVNGELFLANLDLPQSRVLRLAEGVTSASFSPTGRMLAILRSERDMLHQPVGLYLLNLDTGKETFLTDEVADGVGIRGYAPLWSGDGEYVVFLQSAHIGSLARFGIIDIFRNDSYRLTSNISLPIPTSPPILQPGGMLIYEADHLDKASETWFVHVDLSGGRMIDSYTELGAQEEEMMMLGRHDVSLFSSSSLYDVKYQPPVGGSPSSFFSHSNTDPYADGPYNYYCNYQGRWGHRGNDFAKPLSTPIYSGATGVVEYYNNGCTPRDSCPYQPGNSCGSGFGNYVRVRHTNNARTYYAHMSQTNVTTSQYVYRSTVLGYIGSTGSSTGCHLHFEIRYPDTSSINAVDPYYGPCNWITQSLWEGPQPLSLGASDLCEGQD
jgi:murein DD-endopeptidase MepM/ murein hydrolase activator NlpD